MLGFSRYSTVAVMVNLQLDSVSSLSLCFPSELLRVLNILASMGTVMHRSSLLLVLYMSKLTACLLDVQSYVVVSVYVSSG